MNSRQKEVIFASIQDEKVVISELKNIYKKALDDITTKIRLLQADELTQSKIYQLDYQKTLKSQIKAILDNMNSNQYDKISEYLKGSYFDGFLGTMYDLHGQGIPLVFPLDQEKMVKAILNDTKLSKSLYESLGYDIDKLKKEINNEITRGIAGSSSVHDIARNIRGRANVALNKAIRIARTESHRITSQATYDALIRAKEMGADVVKQWDSTLDKKTRPNHVKLDGQIRELEEPFEVNGKKAMYPGGFGVPHEDINCRCVLLQRARWALGEGEVTKMNNETKEIVKIKEKDFKSFKKRYNEHINKLAVAGSVIKNTSKSSGEEMNTVSVEVDEFTPCLRKLSNGEIIQTELEEYIPNGDELKNWEFDWERAAKEYVIFKLIAEGDKRIQGLLALKEDKENMAMYIGLVESSPFNNPHNALFVKKEYSGVGAHLFAEAVKQSYEKGYDGFVYFKAKTKLIDYYKEELGAILINPSDGTMAIDEKGAKKLYERYYGTK